MKTKRISIHVDLTPWKPKELPQNILTIRISFLARRVP